MKRIPITDDIDALVDDEDYDNLSQHKWYFSDGYAVRDHKRVAMHRQIMGFPKGMVVDHIDGNRLNNQRHNLRICTQRENRKYGMQKYTKYLEEMKECE